MDARERDRYGQLLHVTVESEMWPGRTPTPWIELSPERQGFYRAVAERFMGAAHLVTLAALRAMVEARRAESERASAPFVTSGTRACEEILAALDTRFGRDD